MESTFYMFKMRQVDQNTCACRAMMQQMWAKSEIESDLWKIYVELQKEQYIRTIQLWETM